MKSKWYKSIVLNKLSKTKNGTLELVLPSNLSLTYGEPNEKLNATIQVNSENFFRKLVLFGDIGLGEGYVDKDWESPDVSKVVQWFIANFSTTTKSSLFDKSITALANIPNRLQHLLNRNTLTQSRKNIQAHYDISNDFYQLWLDKSMTYSSGFFTSHNQSLEEAQYEKYQRIIDRLDIREHHKVLEVGCGWGGFSCYLAKQVGCKIDCLTLSEEQKAFFEKRIKNSELDDYISIYLKDYRELDGTYDRIVSIEMIEAVGHEYLKDYFSSISRLLKEDGIFGLQAILSADHRYNSYRKGVDWIRKYIFPGGHLPSSEQILKTTSQNTDLQMQHMETFGVHYAKTLKIWAETVVEKKREIMGLGYDERFLRMWLFYLYFCEAAFQQRHIQVAQFIFSHANNDAYVWDRKTPPSLSPVKERNETI